MVLIELRLLLIKRMLLDLIRSSGISRVTVTIIVLTKLIVGIILMIILVNLWLLLLVGQ